MSRRAVRVPSTEFAINRHLNEKHSRRAYGVSRKHLDSWRMIFKNQSAVFFGCCRPDGAELCESAALPRRLHVQVCWDLKGKGLDSQVDGLGSRY